MTHHSIIKTEEWDALRKEAIRIEPTDTLEWFDNDPKRTEWLTLKAAGLVADFSKQRIDRSIFEQLLRLTDAAGVKQAITAMFDGAVLNRSENRAVLHVALRGSTSADLKVDNVNVKQVVDCELNKMLASAEKIRQGQWLGYSGKPITDVVHIGIGGSDLGPRMMVMALTPYHDSKARVHFVSNIDAHEIEHVIANLDAHTTLFLIASKSFGTEETLCNAAIARRWLLQRLGDDAAIGRHMVALSSNAERVRQFGIEEQNRYEFWDWVGGRYSVWSVIGMPLAVLVGAVTFKSLLTGARAMDKHFVEAPFECNMPVVMALIGVWNRNFLGHASQAVVPYYHFLSLLPQYLQQAEMESNGKSVTNTGQTLLASTSPVVWGTPGTDAQHAYFQLLHQGTEIVPVDFIVSIHARHAQIDSQQRLLAHALAQSEALLRGREASNANVLDTDEQIENQKKCPGNRPSTTLLLNQVDAFSLGALIALYEHKIFVHGTILGINSFDQFGVELGKELASELLPMVQNQGAICGRDPSTEQLLRLCAQKSF